MENGLLCMINGEKEVGRKTADIFESYYSAKLIDEYNQQDLRVA